ncbi:MAG: LysR family transcriptional regulator [Pseudomonadota bacterium]
MLDNVTLDQLRMLVAIDDTGSFTAAARQVHRAQSAVSHAIRTLETDLDVVLFDRSTRKPRRTQAGDAIISEARIILARVDHLKARARGISAGMESEICLATSVIAQREGVLDLLDAFRVAFPTISLRLFVEEIGGVPQLLFDGRANLGLLGKPSLTEAISEPLEPAAVGFSDVVAVARPDHPLACLDRQLTEAEMADHRQLVPTSRALPRYLNRMVNDVWEIAELDMRHLMIRRGMGWGTVPLYLVEDDLARGDLITLDMSARPDAAMRVPLFAVHKKDASVGPATRWLIQKMREVFGKF